MISRNFSGIMGFIKSLAKAVWACCSYLFWPQKNKRI